MLKHQQACVRDARDEDIIHKDFTRNAKITGRKNGKKESEKYLDYTEAVKLINVLYEKVGRGSGSVYLLLLLGLCTGMRFAEMIGLTYADLDIDNRKIRINKTRDYKTGKGFTTTKNETSNRVIDLDQKTTFAITYFMMYNMSEENYEDLLFYSPYSKTGAVTNEYANRILKNLLDELGLNAISVHGLRHTHASMLLYQDVSIYYISKRLGHSDINTTQKYYAHVVEELHEKDQQKTTEVFEQLIHV